MKYTITVLAAFFVVLSVAQWPCHDYGWNGPIANCASCNVLGNVWGGNNGMYSVCTNCTSGFFLNQSACIPCTNNCTKCQSNGACAPSGCAAGFAFVSTNFTCVPCPSSLGCIACASSTTAVGAGTSYGGALFYCTACPNNGYYISSTGACVACAAGCGPNSGTTLSINLPYTSGGCTASAGCNQCPSNYVSTTTSGVITCAACAANCNGCTVAGQCTSGSCASGYGMYSNVCSACTVTGCSVCQATAVGTCDTCANGYWFVSGSNCTACTANCISCASATTCNAAGCASGYYLTSTLTCAACPANCTSCQNYVAATPTAAVGYCLTSGCRQNTTLQNGVCYPCPANCTSCTLTSSTATTTVCLQCQLGFGLNDTNGVCVQCPSNCDYCDGTGVCTQCRQATSTSWTYFPIVGGTNGNFQSATAVQVTQGYYLPPNQCQQCPYNCSSCANSTYCYNNCTKNYLYNATTAQCLPNGVERIVLAGFALLSVVFYFV